MKSSITISPKALLEQTTRLLSTMSDVRLACVNVLQISTMFMNDPFDEKGRNVHIQRLIQLRDWARPIALASEKISFHVLENMDPAEALIEFAEQIYADQILMCARAARAITVAFSAACPLGKLLRARPAR